MYIFMKHFLIKKIEQNFFFKTISCLICKKKIVCIQRFMHLYRLWVYDAYYIGLSLSYLEHTKFYNVWNILWYKYFGRYRYDVPWYTYLGIYRFYVEKLKVNIRRVAHVAQLCIQYINTLLNQYYWFQNKNIIYMNNCTTTRSIYRKIMILRSL